MMTKTIQFVLLTLALGLGTESFVNAKEVKLAGAEGGSGNRQLAVDIVAGTVIVGAHAENYAKIYAAKNNRWEMKAQVSEAEGSFGWAVAIGSLHLRGNPHAAIVGAPNNSDSGDSAGAALSTPRAAAHGNSRENSPPPMLPLQTISDTPSPLTEILPLLARQKATMPAKTPGQPISSSAMARHGNSRRNCSPTIWEDRMRSGRMSLSPGERLSSGRHSIRIVDLDSRAQPMFSSARERRGYKKPSLLLTTRPRAIGSDIRLP